MKKIICLALLVLLAVNRPAVSQWVQTSGPSGGSINALVASGTTLFAGTNEKVYRSTNSGQSWQPASSGMLMPIQIVKLKVIGISVFAATSGGLYRSTNNGDAWMQVGGGLPARPASDVIAQGSLLFANVIDSGGLGIIYSSSDNGNTWTATPSQINNNPGNNPDLFNSDVAPAFFAAMGDTLFAATSLGVARTTNAGMTWTDISTATFGDPTVQSILVKGTELFMGIDSHGIWKTMNGGSTWSQQFTVTVGDTPFAIQALALDGQKIYAAVNFTNEGLPLNARIYTSTDDGASWLLVSNAFTDINTISPSGNQMVVGNSNGVLISTNTGLSWQGVNTGISNANVRSFALKSGKVFAAASEGVCVSTDGGVNWADASGGQRFKTVAVVAKGTDLFLAASDSGIYHSTNDGQSWFSASGGLTGFALQVVSLAASGNNLIAGTQNGTYFSSNNGANWTLLTGPFPIDRLTLGFAANGNKVFAISGGVYLSTDNGVTWSVTNNGFPSNSLWSSAIIAFGSTVIVSGINGPYISTNDGVSWSAVSGFPSTATSPVVTSFAQSGTTLMAGTTNPAGLYVSTNGGFNWQSTGAVLPNNLITSAVSSLLVNGQDVLAGTGMGGFGDNGLFGLNTGYGVWKRSLASLLGVKQSVQQSLPKTFALNQNYPNPFNPSTTIAYALPQAAVVTLKVYDVLGREVATLVNEKKIAGSYSVSFDGSRFASGVYFYRLTSGNDVQTKRMMLIK
jgi:hypothetical protein